MNSTRHRLIVFTRFPDAGQVKTRLIPRLGPEAATALHRRLVLRTLRVVNDAVQQTGAELEIRFTGGTEEAMHHWVGDQWKCAPQIGHDLGARMSNAFSCSFNQGVTASVLIGTDCPNLTPEILHRAFAALESQKVVLGPARDGGYYLLGLRSPLPHLFENIRWGTDQVLAQTLKILEQLKLKPALLPELEDIDRAEDLAVWQQICKREESDLERISVIIPTLNEGPNILSVIKTAQRSNPFEIIIVDGESLDGTIELARSAGTRTLGSKAGRARQMNAGAALARGNVLLFLHADTFLTGDWTDQIRVALTRKEVAGGAFRFGLNGAFRGKRFVEFATNFRSRWLEMPYGDQALFLRTATFEASGGFSDLPILEDYEFIRRLRSLGRIVTVPQPAMTSARRWQQSGVVRTTLINQIVIAGYRLGFAPRKLAILYHRQKRHSAGDQNQQLT